MNYKTQETTGGLVEVALKPNGDKIDGKIEAYGLKHEFNNFDFTWADLGKYLYDIIPLDACDAIMDVIINDLRWENVRDALEWSLEQKSWRYRQSATTSVQPVEIKENRGSNRVWDIESNEGQSDEKPQFGDTKNKQIERKDRNQITICEESELITIDGKEALFQYTKSGVWYPLSPSLIPEGKGCWRKDEEASKLFGKSCYFLSSEKFGKSRRNNQKT